MRNFSSAQAFSLVELSIVLVILGLLTGGILAGQSLIRASELRAVTTEYNRYITASQTFRDKYFALAGDMNNAASFWTSTVNGNGNGSIENAAAASATAECYRFWQQLALGGLIEGTYTGLNGPGGTNLDSIPGTNVPRSKMGQAGWSTGSSYANYAGDGQTLAFDFGNILVFGGSTTGFMSNAPLLKPEEAWNIDTKMDDGKPGSGRIFGNPRAGDCATSASVTDYSGNYQLSVTSASCSLYFAKAL